MNRSPQGERSLYAMLEQPVPPNGEPSIYGFGPPFKSSAADPRDSSSSKASASDYNVCSLTPDYSIFFDEEKDALHPIPIDQHRTERQQAALKSMLQESVEFLFGNAESMLNNNKANLSPLDAVGQQQGTLSFLSNDDADVTNNKKRQRVDDPFSIEQDSRSNAKRFRSYQTDNWDSKYDDLMEYRQVNHHCCVPYDYPPYPSLARWVKRQRYQYKMLREGRPSAMTPQRMQALEKIGFLWDAHTAAWERRLFELKAYLLVNGDCNVPSNYKASKKLHSWVKCQRRQYELYKEGKHSTMTEYRVQALSQLCFEWNVRGSEDC